MKTDDRSLDLFFDELLAAAQASIQADIADELALIKPDFPALLAEMQRSGVDIDGAAADADNESGRGRRDSLVLVAEDGQGPARSTTSGTAFRLLEPESDDEQNDTKLDAVSGGLLDEYDASDDPLAALTSDARLEIEADIAARRLLPIPELSTFAGTVQSAESSTVQSVQGGEPRLRWLGVAMAIAAATLLIWGLGPALAKPLLGGPTASQAQWSEREASTQGRASAHGPSEEAEPAPTKKKRRTLPHDDATPPEIDPGAALQDARGGDSDPTSEQELQHDLDTNTDTNTDTNIDTHVDTNTDTNTDTRADKHTAKRRSRTRAQSLDLDALETKAESLWRAGDREGAITLLRTIIRRARGQRRADLAYGDLFTITRQLYGREREAAVWREYLQRFPRGRYADDARAGLCRRMTDAQARSCWSSYALDFAEGSHRLEAARATRDDSSTHSPTAKKSPIR